MKYVEKRVRFGTKEVPRGDAIRPSEFYAMVDETGKVVAVNFLCPCGCDLACFTPVTDKDMGEPKKETRWHYSLGPNGPTLEPSIRVLSGCKAHFNITDGESVMHEDSGK